MRFKVISIFFALLGTVASFKSLAQTNNRFSFQAVVRDGASNLLANTNVGIRASIMAGNANGQTVFSETHQTTTNANGLISLQIGGGANQNGNLGAINWHATNYFIKAEIDPNGGTNYSLSVTTQMLAVPYATQAGNGIMRVSLVGDSLILQNGNHLIIPGISVANLPPANLANLTCGSPTISGNIYREVQINNAHFAVGYQGGNGGTYGQQSYQSRGVTGLTATIQAGNLTSGAGSLQFELSGTATNDGIAFFDLTIAGKSCTVEIPVLFLCGTSTVTFSYRGSNVTYGTVVGANNKCWLDRNLGAAQVATSATDANAYGDLFQWGRSGDGHQSRTTFNALGPIPNMFPNSPFFIVNPSNSGGFNDWLTPPNSSLWVNGGTNNPCPGGFKVPSAAEWTDEVNSWTSSTGVFDTPLKLTYPGTRSATDGLIQGVGVVAGYWSSSPASNFSSYLYLSNQINVNQVTNFGSRGTGQTVRCIRN